MSTFKDTVRRWGRFFDQVETASVPKELRRHAEKIRKQVDGYLEHGGRPKPTHYAVIDEHGEIVQSFKVASYRNADFLCNSLIQLISHDHDTSGWTVRGVTIHE